MTRLDLEEDQDDTGNSIMHMSNLDDVTIELKLGITFVDKESFVLARKKNYLKKIYRLLIEPIEVKSMVEFARTKNTSY